MTLPGDSSFPAESSEKLEECSSIGHTMRALLEKNILPRDVMTRSAFENAMVRSENSSKLRRNNAATPVLTRNFRSRFSR